MCMKASLKIDRILVGETTRLVKVSHSLQRAEKIIEMACACLLKNRGNTISNIS